MIVGTKMSVYGGIHQGISQCQFQQVCAHVSRRTPSLEISFWWFLAVGISADGNSSFTAVPILGGHQGPPGVRLHLPVILFLCRWGSHPRIVGYEMRWRTGASHLCIQGTITAPAQSLEERLTSLLRISAVALALIDSQKTGPPCSWYLAVWWPMMYQHGNENVICCLYVLMTLISAGFHGNTGTGPHALRQIYLTYIIPRCTYGVESIDLVRLLMKKSHLNSLERYYRKTLKYLMSLPQCAASDAIHLIIGIPPVTVFIPIKALERSPRSHHQGLWCAILSNVNSVKEFSSNSWLTYHLTNMYGLPSQDKTLYDIKRKNQWKAYYHELMLRSAADRMTMSNLHPQIWCFCQKFKNLLLCFVRINKAK